MGPMGQWKMVHGTKGTLDNWFTGSHGHLKNGGSLDQRSLENGSQKQSNTRKIVTRPNGTLDHNNNAFTSNQRIASLYLDSVWA